MVTQEQEPASSPRATGKNQMKLQGAGGFPVAQVVDSARDAGDPGLVPGSGRPPAEGKGSPLLGSNLGDPMDRRARWATVHGVA